MSQFRKHGAWLVLSLAGFLMAFGLSSCQTAANFVLSTQFSQAAFETDKELRDESLALIDKAKHRTRYSKVTAKVEALLQKIGEVA